MAKCTISAYRKWWFNLAFAVGAILVWTGALKADRLIRWLADHAIVVEAR